MFYGVRMVLINLPIFNSSSLLSEPLRTISSMPIAIGITITPMFHNLLISLARSEYLFFFLLLQFLLRSTEIAKSTIWHVLSFLLIITWSGLLVMIRWYICISKSLRILCLILKDSLSIYHLVEWSNFNFLHNSQYITLSTQSCLYLFSTSFLRSLIMGLIILSFSPHNLLLLFCSRLSILTLIYLVFMVLFCAVIRRDSV